MFYIRLIAFGMRLDCTDSILLSTALQFFSQKMYEFLETSTVEEGARPICEPERLRVVV